VGNGAALHPAALVPLALVFPPLRTPSLVGLLPGFVHGGDRAKCESFLLGKSDPKHACHGTGGKWSIGSPPCLGDRRHPPDRKHDFVLSQSDIASPGEFAHCRVIGASPGEHQDVGHGERHDPDIDFPSLLIAVPRQADQLGAPPRRQAVQRSEL
jgi:hypothetical protein